MALRGRPRRVRATWRPSPVAGGNDCQRSGDDEATTTVRRARVVVASVEAGGPAIGHTDDDGAPRGRASGGRYTVGA